MLSFPFFSRQFWSFKKPITRMQVASTLKKNNGKRESILLLQILRKMVCINYCGNFTTFIITLISPIEISVLKKKINFMAFLVITWWLFLLILRGALRIIGSCLFVQGSAWPTSDRSSHQEWNGQPKVTLFSYYSMSFTPKNT